MNSKTCWIGALPSKKHSLKARALSTLVYQGDTSDITVIEQRKGVRGGKERAWPVLDEEGQEKVNCYQMYIGEGTSNIR